MRIFNNKKYTINEKIDLCVLLSTREMILELCKELQVGVDNLGYGEIEEMNNQIAKSVRKIMVDAIMRKGTANEITFAEAMTEIK